MASIETLPVELLEKILAHLDFASASALCQTCRHYYDMIPQLYCNKQTLIQRYQGTREWPGVYIEGKNFVQPLFLRHPPIHLSDVRAILYKTQARWRVAPRLPPSLVYPNVEKIVIDVEFPDTITANHFVATLCADTPRLHTVHLNGVTHFNAVAALAHVRELHLRGTSVKDVSCLRRATVLDISYTEVEDVSMLTHVQHLNVSRTTVRDVSALRCVQTLNLQGCQRITSVHGLTQLRCLNIQGTNVSDVRMLPQLQVLCGKPQYILAEQLQQLRYHGDQKVITRVLLLWDTFTALHTLDLSHQSCCTNEVLPLVRHVTRLNISYTNVTVLPKDMQVQVCLMRHCAIQDVSMLHAVQVLDMEGTKVVDVGALVQVRALSVRATGVRQITALPALTYLNINDTAVSRVDGVPKLRVLACTDTRLSTIVDLTSVEIFYEAHDSLTHVQYNAHTQQRIDALADDGLCTAEDRYFNKHYVQTPLFFNTKFF